MSQTYPALPSTLLIISLKMYFSPSRTLAYLHGLLTLQTAPSTAKEKKLLLALIPDFLTIHPCAQILRDAHASDTLLLGAQDAFWDTGYGAYTGEVAPRALRETGVSIVELGHAERRAIFGESDGQVARKAGAVTGCGMVPLVCVGEITPPTATGDGGDGGKAVEKAVEECAVQIRPVLDAIPPDAPVIFAYEPVWAIGQPVPASVDHVAAVVQGIRRVIHLSSTTPTGDKRTGDVRVLYGGSAGPGLWGAGGLGKAVDGMFLGRFAHEVEGVQKVVTEVEQTL